MEKRMPRFHLVQVPDTRPSSSWTIEQITPGERPVPVAFYGPRGDVEAEVFRLNAGGKVREKMIAPASRHRRQRNKPTAR
jgi:hypothetical protein